MVLYMYGQLEVLPGPSIEVETGLQDLDVACPRLQKQ
jgi:hypothetical protein